MYKRQSLARLLPRASARFFIRAATAAYDPAAVAEPATAAYDQAAVAEPATAAAEPATAAAEPAPAAYDHYSGYGDYSEHGGDDAYSGYGDYGDSGGYDFGDYSFGYE